MFNYCYHCGKDFCQECSDNHLIDRRKRKFIKFNEKDITCLEHFKEFFQYFCEDCEENICEKCFENNHKNHNIIKLEEYIHSFQEYIDVISERNKVLSDIIRFNQIFLNIYGKFPNKYYYIKSIKNINKSIEKENLRDPYLKSLTIWKKL